MFAVQLFSATRQLARIRQPPCSPAMFVNSQAPAETAARLALTSSSAPVGHACSEDQPPINDCVTRTCTGSLNLATVAASRTSSATSPFVILKSRSADFAVASQFALE